MSLAYKLWKIGSVLGEDDIILIQLRENVISKNKTLFSKKTGCCRNEWIMHFINKDRKTLIKIWLGKYALKENKLPLKFAIDTGHGSKNSQCFDVVEVLNKNDRKFLYSKYNN